MKSAVPVPPLRWSRRPPEPPVRCFPIAFLGLSRLTTLQKMMAIANSPRYDVRGVWDPDRSAAFRYALKGFRVVNQRHLFKDRKVEAFVIEAGLEAALEMAAKAFETGRHVHLDRPGRYSHAEFQQVARLAESAGRVLQPGFTWRANPAILALAETVAAGYLGSVRQIAGSFPADPALAAGPPAPFQQDRSFDTYAEIADAMIGLFGAPDTVAPFRQNGERAVAELHWPGIAGRITAQRAAAPLLELRGANGVLAIHAVAPPRADLTLVDAAGPYRNGSQPLWFRRFTWFVKDFEAFADAMEGTHALSRTLAADVASHDLLLRLIQ